MKIKNAFKNIIAGCAVMGAATVASAGMVLPDDQMTAGYGVDVDNDGVRGFFFDTNATPDITLIDLDVLGTPTTVEFIFSMNAITQTGSGIGTIGAGSGPITASLTPDGGGSAVWTDSWSPLDNAGIFTVALQGLSGAYDLVLSTTDVLTGEVRIQAVPIPAAAILFGTALAGFAGFSARRKA